MIYVIWHKVILDIINQSISNILFLFPENTFDFQTVSFSFGFFLLEFYFNFQSGISIIYFAFLFSDL